MIASFPLSKRAVSVVIEPMDPAVHQALERLRQRHPSLLENAKVEKIIVHPGTGPHFGEVRSGPGENPRWIHLYKGKIEEHARSHAVGAPADALAHAIEYAIVGVLAHEAGHMKPEGQMTPEQPFEGEPKAEQVSRETLQRVYPQGLPLAAMVLDHLRWKLVPGAPPAEPDLAFMTAVASGNRRRMVKCALRILRHGGTPAALELQDVAAFNGRRMRLGRIARILGFLSQLTNAEPCDSDFGARLACWQDSHGLEPNGKLDDVTLAAVRAQMPDHRNFPRNFGIVWPGRLFRGGQPDTPDQLAAMRDKLGLRRVVTLNQDMPEIADWCQDLGLEHVQADLAAGRPDEPGWEVLGPDIAEFMLRVPTFVHCRHGMDRTGGVVGACRTARGWPCDLAYREAKSYGFKDRFVDMVDRMAQACRHDTHTHRHPPYDIDVVRRLLEEREEQEVLDATPSDLHYTGLGSSMDNSGYDSGALTVLNPFSRQIPTSLPGGGGR